MGRSRLKNVALKLSVVVGAIVVALLIGEGALRLSGYDPIYHSAGPRYMFVADDEMGLTLRPGFEGTHRHVEFSVPVSINSMGFRDEPVGPKTDDTFRILSLGDSFAFGYGVHASESYASTLEQRLAERDDGRTYEVINMGAPSYSMLQMADLLERWIDALQPDVVLFTLLISDDLRTNEGGELAERGGLLFSPNFATLIDNSPWVSFAMNSSNLALMAYVRLKEKELGLDLASMGGPPPEVPWPAGLAYLAVQPPPKIEGQWATGERIIARIAERTAAAGARCVLFPLPLPYLCDAAYWQRMLDTYEDLDAEAFDLRMASRRLAPVCAELGVSLFDPVPGVPGIPDVRLDAGDFFPANLHFNVSGNAKIGRMLAAFLDDEGLLGE